MSTKQDTVLKKKNAGLKKVPINIDMFISASKPAKDRHLYCEYFYFEMVLFSFFLKKICVRVKSRKILKQHLDHQIN